MRRSVTGVLSCNYLCTCMWPCPLSRADSLDCQNCLGLQHLGLRCLVPGVISRLPGSYSLLPSGLSPAQPSELVMHIWKSIFSCLPFLVVNSRAVQKKSFVDKLLVLAGSGLFGSLVGVVFCLVQGQTIGHTLPRALLTAAFCCIGAIVLLISLTKQDESPKPATA